MQDSPAKMYALVFGVVLTLSGLAGFFVESSFSGDDRSPLLGFDVNGWHNLVHLGSGLVGLLAWKAGAAASRQYALGLGVVYLVITIWGFAMGDGETLLGIIPINTADNFLHLAIALAGLAAYAMSAEKTDSRHTTA